MGVYIKGMKMPKSCGKCDYCHPTDKLPYWCYLKEFPIKPSETDLRDGLCPLVSVTEPHGDLIDRDRAIEGAKADGAWAALAYAPAVIEAEGE